MRIALVPLGLALLPAISSAQSSTKNAHPRLAQIRIQTDPIFQAKMAKKRVLARWVNALHWSTRESVVRREIWFSEGERVSPELAAELERNLRAIGLFSDVSVVLVPTDRPGYVDLEVQTTDRLSLVAGAGATFVGGVGKVGAALGERNFLGYGDRIGASYSRNTEGEFRGSVSYRDLHIGDSWVLGSLSAGRTEEGDFQRLRLSRPFKHLQDPWSWSANVARSNSETDYFEAGESVAEVPLSSSDLELRSTWRQGPRNSLWRQGIVLRQSDQEFGAATGPAAAEIEVPGDTERVFGGFLWGHEWISSFREVRGLDTLDYIQDIELGRRFELLGGAQWRAEAGESEHTDPLLFANGSTAFDLGTDRYGTLSLGGFGRYRAGELRGWQVGGAVHGYVLDLGAHSLAGSLALDATFEQDDLPRELTLGEDNGLRGYPAREFSGTRRLRLNLEDRMNFGFRTYAFEMGFVAFYDAGWVWDQGGDPGDPLQSVGLGLRFGSSRLLGRGVLRVDLAFPLDQVQGRSEYDPLLSISVGQVFSFRGNSSFL